MVRVTPSDRGVIIATMAIDIETEQLHRFTLDEYHRLIELGAFNELPRVELIEGFLLSMSAKTPEHEAAVMWLARIMIGSTDPDVHMVGIGTPLTIQRSEPEPDITVVRRDAPKPYHAADADLVIEVSWSSLHRDLKLKAPVFAAAGLADYWVIDLRAQRVVVHREPTPDGYGSVAEYTDGAIRPLATDLPAVDLVRLFDVAGV